MWLMAKQEMKLWTDKDIDIYTKWKLIWQNNPGWNIKRQINISKILNSSLSVDDILNNLFQNLLN